MAVSAQMAAGGTCLWFRPDLRRSFAGREGQLVGDTTAWEHATGFTRNGDVTLVNLAVRASGGAHQKHNASVLTRERVECLSAVWRHDGDTGNTMLGFSQAVYDVVSECVEGMRKVRSKFGTQMEKGGRDYWQFAVVGHIGLELCEWLRDTFNLQQQVVTSALTFSTLFRLPPAVVGTAWAADCNTHSRWKIQVDDFSATDQK